LCEEELMGMVRPSYDVELAAALATLPAAPSFDLQDIPQMRREAEQFDRPIATVLAGSDVVHTEYVIDHDSSAAGLVLSVFHAADRVAPGPCMYFSHGGGMIVGNRFSDAELFPEWVHSFGLTVVSVEYRLAPEHPDPAPSEDCYRGLVWTVEHAGALGIDPAQVLVAGISAGGGLAASTALRARDRGGPGLIGQLLICPMLDDRDTTSSASQFDIGPWHRGNNRVAWSALLGSACGGESVSEYAAPGRAGDLTGLPPAYIEVGSAEVFRDEDVQYASRIWAAGGDAELTVWSGGFHCFWQIEHAAVSHAAKQARHNWLDRLLGKGNTGRVDNFARELSGVGPAPSVGDRR